MNIRLCGNQYMSKLVTVAVTILLFGCAIDKPKYTPTSNHISYSFDRILTEILIEHVTPNATNLYLSDKSSFIYNGLDYDDVVNYNAGCVINELRKNASRSDLNIIYELWVINNGSNKDEVVSEHGQGAYDSGIESYAYAMMDCIEATSKYIDEKK
jgi:hypothetical protein